MAILLGFLTLLTTLIRIMLKLANQFYKNESIKGMKKKIKMLLRDVARQVFIIFISKYLIVLGRSLSTQHPIERKRDETIRLFTISR